MAHLTMMGEMEASIAHEVNQPLAAVVTNANACLRWLDREAPDLESRRQSVASLAMANVAVKSLPGSGRS